MNKEQTSKLNISFTGQIKAVKTIKPKFIFATTTQIIFNLDYYYLDMNICHLTSFVLC